MSEPLRPGLGSGNTLQQEWFQIFWKVMVAIILFVLLLLVLRVYRVYRRIKYGPVVRRDPSAFVSNQQAQALWGDTPGVIVAGINADNVYRPADKIGDFGSKNPEQVPELQDARLVAESSKARGGAGNKADVIVAERASVSSASSGIAEAVPYVTSARPLRDAIV